MFCDWVGQKPDKHTNIFVWITPSFRKGNKFNFNSAPKPYLSEKGKITCSGKSAP